MRPLSASRFVHLPQCAAIAYDHAAGLDANGFVALHQLQLLVHPLPRTADQVGQFLLPETQGDSNFAATFPGRFPVTVRELRQLPGQTSSKWLGRLVLHQPVELPRALRVEAQERGVKLGVVCQDGVNVLAPHRQQRRRTMRRRVVRSAFQVEHLDFTEPDAWFHVAQRRLPSLG